ncbi:MAG: NAD-dependent epimerase/dehydratase family protein, partial [Acidimicrobiales bacterium]
HDPYSASKAGAELVVDAYRSSYFPADRVEDHGVRLASVRAGNVIGGGDWAVDRIVPDAVRALSSGKDLVVRNPRSTRPWQHVLEPLSGYLQLAGRLHATDDPERWAGAWNFGPFPSEEATVGRLADAVVGAWGSGRWVSPASAERDVEAASLRIAADKAISCLGWRPRWGFDETVRRTVAWYRRYFDGGGDSMRSASLADIAAYEASGGGMS